MSLLPVVKVQTFSKNLQHYETNFSLLSICTCISAFCTRTLPSFYKNFEKTDEKRGLGQV